MPGSRISVEVVGNSAELQRALQHASASLKGLGDVVARETARTASLGAETVKMNERVAGSFRQVAANVGSSTRQQTASYTSGVDRQVAASRRLTSAMERNATVARETANVQRRASEQAAAASSAAADRQAMSARRSQAAYGAAGAGISRMGRNIAIGLAGAAAASVDLAVKFQSNTTRLQTQAGATTRQVDQLRKGMLQMAGQVGFVPNQLANGMYHVVSSMNAVLPKATRVKEELQILKIAAEGAKVGHSDLEETTYALASALNALHLRGSDASHTMGQLNAIVGAGDMTMKDLLEAMKSGLIPAARTFGVSLQSVGSALAVMGDMGMRGALAGTRLRMSLALLGAPSEKAAKYLKDIGMSSHEAMAKTDEMSKLLSKAGLRVTTLAGDLRKPNGLAVALQDLNRHLRQSGLSADASAALISHAFGGGRSGAAIQLMAQNTDRLKLKFDQIGQGANTFGRDWQKVTQTTQFKLDQLRATVTALAVKLGDALLPAANKVVHGISDVVSWFQRGGASAHALEVAIGTLATVAIGSYLLTKLAAAIKMLRVFATVLGNPLGAIRAFGAATGGAGAGAAGMAGAAATLTRTMVPLAAAIAGLNAAFGHGGGGGPLGSWAQAASSLTAGLIKPGTIRNALDKAVHTVSGLGDRGRELAQGLSKGFGGELNNRFHEDIAKALNSSVGRSAAGSEQAGRMIAQKLQQGWSQFKFTTEPLMFQQFKAEMAKMPAAARNAAIVSTYHWMQGMESQGRLAKGSADAFLNQAKQTFSGFTTYMGVTGNASASAFAAAMRLTQAKNNLKSTMQNMRGDLDVIPQAMDKTKGSTEKKAAAVAMALRHEILTNGSAKVRAQASKDLAVLLQNMDVETKAMASVVAANFSDMGRTIQTFGRQIGGVIGGLVGLLGQLAGALGPIVNTIKQSVAQGSFTAANLTGAMGAFSRFTGGRAAGGFVPGDPTRDGTLALLSGGEFVVTGGGQRMMEGAAPGLLHYLYQHQPRHFQAGGAAGQPPRPGAPGAPRVAPAPVMDATRPVQANRMMLQQIDRAWQQHASQLHSVQSRSTQDVATLMDPGGGGRRAVQGNLRMTQMVRTQFRDMHQQVKTIATQQQNDVVTLTDRTRVRAKASMDTMLSNSKSDYRQMQQTSSQSLRQMSQDSQTRGDQIVANLSGAFGKADTAAKGSYDDMDNATIKVLTNVVDSTNKALKTLGVKPVSFHVSGVKAATGGYIGAPGEKGRDEVPIVVGRGEAVLNHGQQAVVNSALEAQGIGGLPDLFKQVSAKHYMYAQGGFAGLPKFAAGGQTVTASTFGGPSDPGTGSTGYRGDNLYQHPDSFAELNMGTALGNLPYLAPVNVTAHGHTGTLYKRDIGAGGGGIGGAIRAIDLWFQAANALGVSGLELVQVTSGSGHPLNIAGAGPGGGVTVPTIKGPKVTGPSGSLKSIIDAVEKKVVAGANTYVKAHAPVMAAGAGAPGPAPMTGQAAVDAMIRKANEIASHNYPYVWGGGHGQLGVGPYDCSGAVSAVLGAAGLISAPMVSGDFDNWGQPGTGKWVSIFSSPSHVFMQLAGHYFGTSGMNPGGGANWIPSFPESMPFTEHPPGLTRGGIVDEGGHILDEEILRTLPHPAAERARLKKNPRAILEGMAPGGYAGQHGPRATIKLPHQKKPPQVGKPPHQKHGGTSLKTLSELSWAGSTISKIEQDVTNKLAQYTSLSSRFSVTEQDPRYLNPDGSQNQAGLDKQKADDEQLLGIAEHLLADYQHEKPVLVHVLRKYLGKKARVEHLIKRDNRQIDANKRKLASNKVKSAGIRSALVALSRPTHDQVAALHAAIKKAKSGYDSGIKKAQDAKKAYHGKDKAKKAALSNAVIAAQHAEWSGLAPLEGALATAQGNQHAHRFRVGSERFHLRQELAKIAREDAKLSKIDTYKGQDVKALKAGLSGRGDGQQATDTTIAALETVAAKLGTVQWASDGHFLGINTRQQGAAFDEQTTVDQLKNELAKLAGTKAGTGVDTSQLASLLETENLRLAQTVALQEAQFKVLKGMIPEIPHYAQGGPVIDDGLIYAHKGEHVVPAGGTLVSGGGGDTVIVLEQHYDGQAGELMRFVDQRIAHPNNVRVVSRATGMRTSQLQRAPGGFR